MTAPRRSVPAVVAVASCVTAALAYSGAVTMLALFAYLLPTVVVTGAVTTRAARVSRRAAAVTGLVVALVLAEVVNLASGTGNGPAARSTFAAAGFTAMAVALVCSRWPALFLTGVVGVLAGALALGAGAEVAPVGVATAVVAVVALGLVEASSRQWVEHSRGVMLLLVSALIVGGAVELTAFETDRQRDGAAPAVLAPAVVDESIRPPRVLGDPNPPSTTPTPTPTRSRAVSPPTPDVAVLWRWAGLLIIALVLLLLARLGWVWLRWRLLRRRLRSGSAAQQVAGAWVWSVRRLRAAGWPVPPSLSADRVASTAEITGLPRTVRPAFRRVADATVDAVYAPPGGSADPERVWRAADDVGRAAVSTLPRSKRLAFRIRSKRLAFRIRPLSSSMSPSVAPAPGPTEEHRL